MGTRITLILLVKICFLALPAALSMSNAAYAANNQVLIINSYHSGLSWTDSVMNGIQETLKQSGRDLQVSAEYLDARRYVHDEQARLIRQTLIAKLRRNSPDVVIVSDNDALRFALEQRDILFPHASLVFCGVNNFHPSMIAGYTRITGVSEEVSIKETVDLALHLHPETREIIVIGRTSIVSDNSNRQSFVAALPGLPKRVRVSFWDDLPATELRSRLAKVTSGSLIFINGLMTDESGRQLMYGETTKWISRNSTVPAYSLWDTYFGYGIVGGKLVSGYQQGRIAAELAMRILNGEKAERIPVISAGNANLYMFDYRQLARFAIPLAKLPKGSIFVNRPDSYYELHKGLIWTTAGVILLLTAFVTMLGNAVIRMRRAEEQLRQSNLVVENSPVVLFRWRAAKGWPVELVSRNVTQFGYKPEEFLSGAVPFASIIHPQDLDQVTAEVNDYSDRGDDRFEQEYRIVTKDGAIRWVYDRTVIERKAYGQVTHYQGIVIDITERKQAEQDLLLTKFCVDNAGIGIYHTSEQYIHNANDFACKSLGYSVEELRTMSVFDIDPEITIEGIQEISRLLENNGSATHQTMHRRKDGTIFPVEITTNVLEYQGKRYGISFVKDITERRQAEKDLRESQRFLAAIFEQSPYPMWVSDDKGTLIRMNQACRDLLRITNEILVRKYNLLEDNIVKQQGAMPLVKRVFEQGEKVQFTLNYDSSQLTALQLRETTQLVLDVTISPILDARKKLINAVIQLQDITDRKRAEETLRGSEERFKALVETTSDWIWEIDSAGVYTYASPKVKDILGYDPREIIGKTPFDLMPPEEAERIRLQFADIAGSGKSFYGLVNMNLHKNGQEVVLETGGVPIFAADGKLCGYRGIDRDITERRRAEEASRFTQYAVDKSFAQAFWIKPSGHIFYVNNAACRSLGYTRDELLGMTVSDIDPTFPPEVFAEYWRELKEKGYITLETWQRAKDGRVYPIEVSSNYVVFDGNEYNCAFVMDISERKRAEEALRESEEKFRVLAETSPTAIFLFQGEMIIYANPATERLFGYTADELLLMRFWDWAHEDFREIVRANGLARQKGEAAPGRYESRFVTKTGDDRWLVVSAGLIEYHGRPAGVASFLDITESKRVEGQLRDSLAEKEVLLKEVHHRVKNNLQIITTLLDLQFENIHDEHSLHALRESQDRIKAMALVHEKLYQSMDLASIDFAEYIEKLALFLFNSYAVDPEQVTLTVDVGHTPMEIDRAIPCGLIINELVSNALKYAFPAGRKGEITIRLRCGDDGRILLAVADNGIGLPPGLDFRDTQTLGLQLVNMLTKQLNGEITLLLKEGAAFTIRFKS